MEEEEEEEEEAGGELQSSFVKIVDQNSSDAEQLKLLAYPPIDRL